LPATLEVRVPQTMSTTPSPSTSVMAIELTSPTTG
jgi:hypothetical protein